MKETATALRDKFFACAIPTNRPLILPCFAAGDALAAFVRTLGVETRLYRRNEFWFSPACRLRMREYLTEILTGIDALPRVPGSDSARAKAIAALSRYAKALAE